MGYVANPATASSVSTTPAQAPPGATAGSFGGPLPPGFSPLGYAGAISVHPVVANQFPGTTLAQKVSLYQEKLRSRQGEPVQPFISPTPTPSVALADLPGSAALSSSSLDPFLFSPTSAPASSALGDVLVPFDPDLGTLPIGEQAPVTVSSGTDPNIFSAQVEDPTTVAANVVGSFFSQGGAAMAGLGFRPLGYADGSEQQGVVTPLSASGPGQRLAGELMSMFDALYSQQDWDQLSEFVRNNEDIFFTRGAPASFLGKRIANMLQNLVDHNMVSLPPTAEETTAETETLVPAGSYTTPKSDVFSEELTSGALMGLGHGLPVEETVTETESMTGYPGLQAGGHVGRGTMAGELGRRGDLSVRQAGETMQERWKRMHGYAGGGYASRGTVAGELPRYGHMSVREEGESMGELAKRHRDQDWYNRMGRGLGSLRRRMA